MDEFKIPKSDGNVYQRGQSLQALNNPTLKTIV